MNNSFDSFDIKDIATFKQKMLNWANRFNIFCFLDNHQYPSESHSYECIMAAGAYAQLQCNAGKAFESLKQFHLEQQDWIFGHLAYDLKNECYPSTSSHKDGIGFPDLQFFVPEILVIVKNNTAFIRCHSGSSTLLLEAILLTPLQPRKKHGPVPFQQRFQEAAYLKVIEQLQQHILRGDCYEINFCQEFFAEHITLDPLAVFESLSAVSPNPFGACYKLDDRWLLCASPERYLKKTGKQLLAAPIKGTWKRNLENKVQDEINKQLLQHHPKERAENVMVVDLIRNDLSIISEPGSVIVEELFGIYTYPQVHQMISTISSKLKPALHWTDAIKATFPMGSMTGAPKKRVLALIEQYERTRRGIFSGALGYVTPEGDFDFNVVIRSLMYQQTTQYLSYQVGSGITYYSNAQSEYEECLLKAAAFTNIFNA